MSEHPVWPESELRDYAAALTPAMRHALLRCSEYTDWTAGHQRTFARIWADVVAGYRHATFRRTIGALERRGLVEVVNHNDVAATLLGLAVRGRLIREGYRPDLD